MYVLKLALIDRLLRYWAYILADAFWLAGFEIFLGFKTNQVIPSSVPLILCTSVIDGNDNIVKESSKKIKYSVCTSYVYISLTPNWVI